MSIRTARLRNVAAMIAIGDGVLALLNPRGHNLLWPADVPGHRRAMDWFVERSGLTRVGAILEIRLGIWLAGGDQRRITREG